MISNESSVALCCIDGLLFPFRFDHTLYQRVLQIVTSVDRHQLKAFCFKFYTFHTLSLASRKRNNYIYFASQTPLINMWNEWFFHNLSVLCLISVCLVVMIWLTDLQFKCEIFKNKEKEIIILFDVINVQSLKFISVHQQFVRCLTCHLKDLLTKFIIENDSGKLILLVEYLIKYIS